MQTSIFRLFACVSVAFVISGCGARLAGTHDFIRPLVDEPLGADTPEDTIVYMEDTLIVEELVESSVRDSVVMLLAKARARCDDFAYDQADSLLRRTCFLIDSTIASEAELETFYEDIAHIYAIQLPPQYSENIPEQISALVFRYQMNFSLDSLTAEIDSSVFSRNCLEGAPYNVPISKHSRVRKALTLTLDHRIGYIQRSMSRGSRYLPFMKSVFADSGLPTDLVYLPIIESGFNYRAYSHAHAAGVWQFIPSTGRVYGLRKNYWLDERRDPIKATYAAVKYLKKLHGDFNDWHLALAAYNCGEGRVGRTIKKADTADYWQLRLPRETMNYVPHYLATMMVAKNPTCFGLEIPVISDTLPAMDTVLISDCMDMRKIAEGISVPLDTLKDFNPHILRWCTPPEVTDVTLYLPHGKAESFRAFYEQLGSEDKVKWYRHRIQRGDNLSTIAQRFKISVSALRSVNDLRSSRIIAGRYLFIPIPVDSNVEEEKTPKAVAGRGESKKSKNVPIPKNGKKISYRLKKGDTMYHISKTYGVSIEQICGWNNIDRPERLTVGHVLTLYTQSGSLSSDGKSEKSPAPVSIPEGAKKNTYTIGKGDNLYSVSQRLNVSMADLAGWNKKDLNAPLIHPGEKLVYYVSQDASDEKTARTENTAAAESVEKCSDCVKYKIAAGDNIYRLSQLFGVDMQTILAVNGLKKNDILGVGDVLKIPRTEKSESTTKAQAANKLVYYTVQKGDNLWRIAQLFEISVKQLYEANNLSSNAVLMPGDTVRVVVAEDL